MPAILEAPETIPATQPSVPGSIPSLPHIVIVGAGFGGLYAARELRHARARVTLLDRRNFHLFQPLLYQVATAALSPGNIAYPIRAILRGQPNTQVLLAEVTGVDVDARQLVLASAEDEPETRLDYDYLILAPGARDSYFGHDQWAQWAPGLKSLEEGLELRRRLLLAFEHAERESDAARRRELLTVAIIGGGPTGVEMAGAIAEIARQVMRHDFRAIDPAETRVVLIEAGARILPAFAPELSQRAAEALRKRGVELWLHTPVTAIQARELLAGREPNMQSLRAGLIVWAAGVRASALGESLGVALERGGRVRVRADLSLQNHPEVFIIGDLAWCAGAEGAPLPGLAPVAMQQGRHAAGNILRALRAAQARGGDEFVPGAAFYRPFHYFDKGNLATIGKAAAVGQWGRFQLWGLPAWLVWVGVHIRYLIGFRNRLVVSLEWLWAYLTAQRAARLITNQARQ